MREIPLCWYLCNCKPFAFLAASSICADNGRSLEHGVQFRVLEPLFWRDIYRETRISSESLHKYIFVGANASIKGQGFRSECVSRCVSTSWMEMCLRALSIFVKGWTDSRNHAGTQSHQRLQSYSSLCFATLVFLFPDCFHV